MNKFNGKKVAILGFGLEGKDLFNYLIKQGANITVFDQKNKKDLNLPDVLTANPQGSKPDNPPGYTDSNLSSEKNVKFECGRNYLSKGLKKFDIIFRSPGVYRYIPEILEAEKSGTEISSATKLFIEKCPAKIIGITGTKGKGTTATLIYKILKQDGKDVYLAGNIGKPFLELLSKLKKSSWVVLELSSFQLIDLNQSPNIAVVLNISTDHLDWHKDRNEYINAKKSIVRYQLREDYAVINSDYSTSRKYANLTKAKIFFFSKKNITNGGYVKDGNIYLSVNYHHPKSSSGSEKKNILNHIQNDNKTPVLVGNTSKLKIKGEHNWENVCAAICAARLAGADISSIKKTVFSFKGLEHRLELAGKYKGVSFYNDSFSTNPQTTIAAVNSFDEPITLIIGGSDKGLGYTKLARKLNERKSVANIVLIGEIAGKINKSLKTVAFNRKIVNLGKTAMKKIVQEGLKITPKGGILLLSPAAASFDMFKDYKDRGEQFKKAVISLH